MRVREPQLYNRYNYARANPVSFLDPDGLRPLKANELHFFNAFFGVDFTSVDVESGLLSKSITTSAGAGGVTVGETIHLSSKWAQRFDHGDPEAVALVGHELVHVAQYRALGMGRFLNLYLVNYSFNRSQGQSHADAYRNLIVEQVARKVERAMGAFLSQNREIRARLESGDPFSESELELISSALEEHLSEGAPLEEGYQFINGTLVRVEFWRE